MSARSPACRQAFVGLPSGAPQGIIRGHDISLGRGRPLLRPSSASIHGTVAIPLIGSDFVVWPVVAIWLVFIGSAWLFGRHLLTTRAQCIVTALVALPVLFLLAFEGGWWLIPADLAWLAIESAKAAIAASGSILARRGGRPVGHAVRVAAAGADERPPSLPWRGSSAGATSFECTTDQAKSMKAMVVAGDDLAVGTRPTVSDRPPLT